MRVIEVQQKSPIRERSSLPKIGNAHRFEARWVACLPAFISGLRIVILPFLAFSFLIGFRLATYSLFLLAISSDFADGWIARKIGAASKFGAYFDATIDFLFVISMFWFFAFVGLYPYWLLPLIMFVYLQFLLTSFFSRRIYDPIGKYYGSLLFGAIGLTLLFSGQLFYNVIIVGIVIITSGCLASRLMYLMNFPTKQ
jgi:phosphatidylglycerophosphate synthase